MTRERHRVSPLSAAEGMAVERMGIKVVDAAQAENADVYVCALADTPSLFTDNMRAPCSACRRPVIYRPHAPVRPHKMCLPCATKMMEAKPDA